MTLGEAGVELELFVRDERERRERREAMMRRLLKCVERDKKRQLVEDDYDNDEGRDVLSRSEDAMPPEEKKMCVKI